MATNLRDISSSEAESDAESEPELQTVQQKQRRKRRDTKYQCPADFVSCDFRPCSRTRFESVNDNNTELWLIKAPMNFNPDSVSGLKVPMMGLKSLQSCKGSQQVYSVLSRPGASAEARLLTTSSQSPSDMVCAPPFAGIMNICESYGDCLGNQAPMAIPACPAPQIPEGLKQRFQPFGSKTPSGHGPKAPEQQEETTDSPMLAKRVKPDPEESGGPKKKKKKDKRTKAEKVEEVEEEISAALSHSLTEEAQETSQELSAPGEEVVEKKKKKKKSKDKSREERTGRAETHFSFKEEVEVKTEPMDFAYGDVESSGKKKKMKKEKKRLDD